LASTALCAGYFVKAYCDSRKIPTEGVKISQTNTRTDPDNKYKHTFEITVQVPESFSQKDREGILRSVEGCSVKKAIQQIPEFKVVIL
jgi:ribosomal protein S12 methylthiotransferase accessory factor